MNLFYQPEIVSGIFHLDPEESKHCVKVLRKNEGDIIRLTDGKGKFYDAIISKADSKCCAFTITETVVEKPRGFHLHLAIAPTKNADRTEWLVEKAVEVGIDRITLIECRHSERSFIRKERLLKVAVSAMKQSIKATIPVIDDLITFQKVLTSEAFQKFICVVDESNPDHLQNLAAPQKSTMILIGPEGDFAQEELQAAVGQGFRKASLGPSRLRTETAGLAACHIINLINQK